MFFSTGGWRRWGVGGGGGEIAGGSFGEGRVLSVKNKSLGPGLVLSYKSRAW